MQNTKKGFTLIELLIVIGILAILVAAVVVVLNPAQLLAQARDGQRMSDMDSLRSAINLYLATASNATLTATSTMTSSSTVTFTGADATQFATVRISSSTAVNSTGWVPVDFTKITGGSPLARLPVDPINDGAHFYAYTANNTSSTYKLITVLESTKYAANMANDGGLSSSYYEIGSDVTGL